jgi:tetratricopeptide (TPR) repeat protein
MYSAREVAAIVGLQESRVRYWAQTGVVGPSEKKSGKGLYSFQDLVGVKTAKELLDRGLSLQVVRKNLEVLRAQLPEVTHPLSQLRVISDGERLVVIDRDTRYEPLSGQLVLDFEVEALSGRAAALEHPSATQAAPSADKPALDTAYQSFSSGLSLEEHDVEAAIAAYRRALKLDPKLAAAHTNLGNLLYGAGSLDEALGHYRTALELDPEQPEARYNLANLLDDAGDHAGALGEWYRVVRECPEFADAHFNLALALGRDGARDRAHAHLTAYLALDSEGEWAERARALLAERL